MQAKIKQNCFKKVFLTTEIQRRATNITFFLLQARECAVLKQKFFEYTRKAAFHFKTILPQT
jgi:hypothetical protein